MGDSHSKTSESTLPKMSAWGEVGRVAVFPSVGDMVDNIHHLRKAIDDIAGDIVTKFALEVDRPYMFTIAISHYKSKLAKKKQVHETPLIIFKNEDAFDGNALRREFYSLFFHACLLEDGLFVGQGRRLVPSNEIDRTKDKQLSALGVAIVEAIVNGDCGFPYLNEALYHFIIGDADYERYLTMDDIPDLNILEFAKRVKTARTDADITDVLSSEAGACMEGTGWPAGTVVKISNRDEFIRHLAKWSVIDKRRAAIEQFKEGLNYKGFLDTLKSNRLLKCLLVLSGEYCMTANYLRSLLSPALTVLNVNNDKEKKAKKFFDQLLREITDQNAGYLFFFMTGVIDPPINVMVLDVTFNLDPKRILPEATACINTLVLPVGNQDYLNFTKSFVTAIEMARVGFGKT